MNCSDVVGLSSSYVAGGLNASESAEFAAHLEGCPACARVVDLDAQLRGAVLAEPVDSARVEDHVRHRIRESLALRRWSSSIRAGAGIAAMLAVAFFAYRSAVAIPPVYADAALDHRDEVVNHERRTWVSDASAVAALAARQGIAASEISAFSPPGYRLEHAKRCRLNGRIFLHLVYADGSHEISVFLRAPDSPRTGAVRTANSGNEYVAAFENTHVSGLVVTGESLDCAVRIARYASSVL